MHRKTFRGPAAALSLFLLLACGEGATEPRPQVTVVVLASPWQTATPASQGMNDAVVNAAIDRARTMPRMLSLLVVRRGRLVIEEYFNGNHADSLNDVRSVTESVISTLTGIAARRGEIAPGSPIGPHLTPWAGQLDDVERSITVRHLLTMSGGWQWDESTTAGYNEWVLSGEPVEYLLRRPLTSNPGTAFTYNSAAVHLLATVLADATGSRIQEYAQQHLFRPLGIVRARWETFADGAANGGAGLDLMPRDLAKLGQLWLQGGDAGNERVLGENWLIDGTAPTYPYRSTAPPLRDQSYGWLWWLTRASSTPSFYAQGYGGQVVWVTPALDLVVVVTHEWRGAGDQASELARNAFDLIANGIIPAIR